MLNMLKLKAPLNHSKSLILGSRDSFLSNFNIFEKINSNHLTLQLRNPKILGNVPHFRPSKIFFILTLHTFRQSLDWPLTSILTSQPMHETCSGSAKTISQYLDLQENHKLQKFLKRRLLVGKKVLYKFPNYTASKLSHLHAVNRQFMCHPQNGQLLEWP